MEILNEQEIFQNEVDNFINGREKFKSYNDMLTRMNELIRKSFQVYGHDIAEQTAKNLITETQRMTKQFEG